MDNFEKRGIKYTIFITLFVAVCMLLCFLFMFKCVSSHTSIHKNTDTIDIVNAVENNGSTQYNDTVVNNYDILYHKLDTLPLSYQYIEAKSLDEYILISKRQQIKHINGLNNALEQYIKHDFDIGKTNFFNIYSKSSCSVNHIFILAHIQFNYEIGASPFDIEYIVSNDDMLKKYCEYVDNHFYNELLSDLINYSNTHTRRFWEIHNHIYLTTIIQCNPIIRISGINTNVSDDDIYWDKYSDIYNFYNTFYF